jgi:hypothetical protein
MGVAQQGQQSLHPAKIERTDVVPKARLLFVIRPLEQVSNGLLVGAKDPFTFDSGDLGGGLVLSFVFTGLTINACNIARPDPLVNIAFGEKASPCLSDNDIRLIK